MIECQICKRQLGALSGKHLVAHGITAAEYREQFPGHHTREQKPVSEETRAKMRASRTGYTHSDETKAKIGSKHQGKTRTPEEIDKWRASYAEYIAENGSPMTGKDRGDAFKKKMSDIAKARPPEMVQAKVEQMWAARRGSIVTDEQRERYSQARLKFMQENPDKLVPKLFNTKPEREFTAELEKRSIAHERNVQVGGRVYDFRLEDMVLIEIDGPYHWNYKMYGNKDMPDEDRMALFQEAKKKDVYKNGLAVKHGYTLYRIKVEGSLPIDWIAQLNNQGFQI
jgi:very-short-patch-repair endonuclease